MEHTKDQIPFLDILIKSNKIHCSRNIQFCLVQKICTIAENNAEKLRNWDILKSNLSKYHSLDSLINQAFQKTLAIPKKMYKNTKNPQIKLSYHTLQHLMQITLIFIALLNPRLIVLKVITLAAFIMLT